MSHVRLPAGLSVLLLSGCFTFNPNPPNAPAIEEIEVGLATASTTGRAVSLAMLAMSEPTPCAYVTSYCSSFPCTGAVDIEFGPACPLFIAGEAVGTAYVAGQWSSADDATVTTEFIDVQAFGAPAVVAAATVTSVSVERSGDVVTIEYVGVNALARADYTGAAVAAANSWDLIIDTQGTSDPTDDDLIVDATSAGGSAGLGALAKVVVLRDVQLAASCRANPIAGSADITEVVGFLPRIVDVEFHAACDGKADVNDRLQVLNFFP